MQVNVCWVNAVEMRILLVVTERFCEQTTYTSLEFYSELDVQREREFGGMALLSLLTIMHVKDGKRLE